MILYCWTCERLTKHNTITHQPSAHYPFRISAVCACGKRGLFSTSKHALAAEGVVPLKPKQVPEAVRLDQLREAAGFGGSIEEITARMDIGYERTTRLLRKAVKAGLVNATRDGKRLWYEAAL